MDQTKPSNVSGDAVDGCSVTCDSTKPLQGKSGIVGKIDNDKARNNLKELQDRESERLNLCSIHENLLISNFFPKEVWIKCFEKLNLEDRKCCRLASPFFENLLLKNQRRKFLFPDVIEILTKSQVKNDYWDPNIDELEKQHSKAWFKTLNTCRLVCKAWNEGLEIFYQNLEMPGTLKRFRDPTQASRFKYIPWIAEKYHISSFEKAQALWNHFEISRIPAAKKNPFLGRYVNFNNVDPFAHNQGFYIVIREILHSFGEDIWYCTLSVGSRVNPTDQYILFKSFLELMPNLKFLHISGFLHVSLTSEFIEENPLPILTKLQELKLTNLQYNIANEVLRQNPQILRLSVCNVGEVDHEVFESLTNLQAIKSKNSVLGYRLVTEIKIFTRLDMLNIGTNEDSLPGPQLFKILEQNCFETLTDLKISNPLAAKWDSTAELEFSKTGRLFLPRLRSLQLSMWDNAAFFLDFILPTNQNLEHLKISSNFAGKIASNVGPCRIREKVKTEQIIEFEGYQENLLDSNIWRLFPKLLTIILKGAEKKLLFSRNIQNTQE